MYFMNKVNITLETVYNEVERIVKIVRRGLWKLFGMKKQNYLSVKKKRSC